MNPQDPRQAVPPATPVPEQPRSYVPVPNVRPPAQTQPQPPLAQPGVPPILPPAQPYAPAAEQPTVEQPHGHKQLKLIAVAVAIVVVLLVVGGAMLIEHNSQTDPVQSPNSGLSTPQPPL